jgi:hypothetical protein
MTLPRIYHESTIPSYLVARPSRDIVLRGQQEATRRWWERERATGHWFVYLSDHCLSPRTVVDISHEI